MSKTQIFGNIKDKLEKIYFYNTTVSLYLFLSVLYKKIINFNLDQRAAAVSFSFMLAVFPGFLFLFTLIPYIPIPGLDIQIMDFTSKLIPAPLFATVSQTLNEIISRPRGDILSFGFLFATFAATNGMMSLMRAFNMALKQREKRTYMRARWIAIWLTMILVGVLLIAIVIIIVGQVVLSFLSENMLKDASINVYGLKIIGYVSVFLIFYVGISCVYYFGPAISKRLKFFNIGSLLASVLCILATNLFSFYIENFNSYNKLYGSIGTLIAIMVWIYLIALILILGFEINISLRTALSDENFIKRPKKNKYLKNE